MRQQQRTIHRRIVLIGAFTVVLFVALLLRLLWVQGMQSPLLTQKAHDSWQRQIPFVAQRGHIVDRHGEPLVLNASTPSVLAIPSQIRHVAHTAQQLADVLHMEVSKLKRLLTQRTMLVRLQPQGRKIDLALAQRIRALQLPGIFVVEDNKRAYPYGSLAAHVLGFTGIDNQGLTGIEAKYDAKLRGSDGHLAYWSDARGNTLPHTPMEYIAPKDGLQLQLTLDQNIQRGMEREMDYAMATLHPRQMMALAVDPTNGEVLAMASRPAFEPAKYRQYPSTVYNRNLPIWMTYEPGSTFKIITLAAALEEKKVTFEQTFYDKGSIEVGGVTLHCWKHGGHGNQTFLEVVQNSCNPGFVVLGQRLGKETLFRYIRDFGFGRKTGIDLAGEENGILFALNRVGPIELATTSFGQGVSVTPIQQVMAVSAAINGGNLYRPHLAKAWRDPLTGEVMEKMPPQLVRKHVITPQTSAHVRQALEYVVAQGTGRQAFIPGYRVGGKTGTAQIVHEGKYSATEHIVSFLGFAPADDPKIVIYVAVDNPQGIQFGGRVAAPIVRNMLEDALQWLHVPPRQQEVPKKFVYGVDQPTVKVPDVVGATKTDVYSYETAIRLAHYGTGKYIVWQQPQAGTVVPEGAMIHVYWADEPPNKGNITDKK